VAPGSAQDTGDGGDQQEQPVCLHCDPGEDAHDEHSAQQLDGDLSGRGPRSSAAAEDDRHLASIATEAVATFPEQARGAGQAPHPVTLSNF
jgi:hypothetical protein